MATNYPGSLDTSTQQPSPSASTEMDDAGYEHDAVHTNHSGAIIALETKVGTGSSTAAANSVLAGTGSGTSGWTTTPTVAGLTVNGDTSSTGHFTAQSGGADGGIVLGQAYSSSYVGLRTANMSESSGNEYNLLTDGNNTFISAGTGGDVYIRGGGNISSCQIVLDSDQNDIDMTGDVELSGRMLVKANGSDILRLRDTGGTDTGGYISFEQSAGTRMGYIGYANNDDIHIRNENSGGNMFFGVQAGWAAYFNTSRDFVPYTNATHDLGNSSLKWQHAYLNYVHVDEVRGSDGSASDPTFTFTNDGDTGMYRSTTNQLSFSTGGSEAMRIPSAGDLRLQREGVVLDATSKSYWSKSPPTGTGNDAEWTAAFGYYYLRRNSSVAADKVNITSDLGTHLTADMIDSVVPKMWARKETPTYPEIGPIADDMDTISPFLVTRGTDAEGEVFMNGIDRNAYLSLLVLAVKDLRARVADLEAA